MPPPSSQVDSPPAADGPDILHGFDYQPRTRVVFGAGRLTELGRLCQELGGRRVLLVSDRGLSQAGHLQRGWASLEAAGLSVHLFDDVRPNPTTDDVDRGLEVARDAKIDLIVGLGGGSSMDCAKGINFLLTNGGRMEDYWGVGKARLPMLPLVAVPSTAGTGSEAQSFALISQARTHRKMACGDSKAACRIAVLDPQLTVSMPPTVTAATGIDAVSHAVESFVTTRRTPISQLFSRQAWRLLASGFPAVLRQPDDLVGRSNVLLGAHLAGAAIENSMLGATHALANPLTARFEITHGVAIGVMLPHVVRFNAAAVGDAYRALAQDAGLCGLDDPRGPERLANLLVELARQAGLPSSLTDMGIRDEHLDALAADAAQQWTATFNPRPVDVETLRGLYRGALE